jgi:hypothetical protein
MDKQIAEKILSLTRSHKADMAEVFLRSSVSSSIEVKDQQVDATRDLLGAHALDRFGAQQRRVAVEDQHVAAETVERCARRHHGVAGTAAFGLLHEGGAAEGLARLAVAADHDDESLGASASAISKGRRASVARTVEHLHELTHPCPGRREDHHGERARPWRLYAWP